jgi:hypothetical protein
MEKFEERELRKIFMPKNIHYQDGRISRIAW